MAYVNVTSPLVTKNGVPYNLQYNSTTGDVQIIQQNAPPGTKPIYQDGKWNASATQLGFTTNEKNELHTQSIASIQRAYNSIGGVNSGAKLPQWASKNFTNGSPGQSSINPSNSVSSTSGGNGGGGIGQLTAALTNPAEAIQNFAVNNGKFGVGNEKALFGGGGMTYPADLMTSQQDYFCITMYSYKPPNSNQIFGGTDGAKSILSSGLQKNSNLESKIGTVFLPMPNSVTDSNSVAWGSDDMSNLSAAVTANTMGNVASSAAVGGIGAIAAAALGGNMKEMAGQFLGAKNILDLVKEGAISPELSTVATTDITSKLTKMQGFGVEPESILARGAGIVPNSNMELLFNGPTLRGFNFTYRLSPRSAEEASAIRKIIRFFKQGMAVKKLSGKSGQASFFLGTPNVFQLEYKSGTKPIDAVNKFKTCALINFNCNFTPEGLWAAYEQGQPVSTIISMQFNELEPIYDTDYQEGNIFDNRGDLSSISSNSVGY